MGTGSVHSGSKGCESSEPLGHSSVQSQSHSPSFKWDWVSQVTVNTAQRTERCMYCTILSDVWWVVVPLAQCIHPLQPVYSSLPAPPRWQCTKRRVLLAHSLTTCCGLMHHRPRVCGRSACVALLVRYQCNAHDSSCIRNTDGNPVRNLFPAN
jgi:hypothetical protein